MPWQRLLTVLLSLVFTLAVDAQSKAAPRAAAAKAADPALPLKAGDHLVVELKHPAEDAVNINARYRLAEDGTMKLPYLKTSVQAAGLTCEQLAQKLSAAFREARVYDNPGFTVRFVSEAGSSKNSSVTVTNTKETGGRLITVKADSIRLYMAMMSAGGPGEFEDLRRIAVVRDGVKTIYDVRRINPDGSNNPVLKAGDTIATEKNTNKR